MTLDAYQLCPCGSGKKIKFCCSKDMVGELEKVLRAVQGDQKVAALDQIDRLLGEKGPIASLLALKAETQLMQNDSQGAKRTIAAFLEVSPHNPVALAFGAMVAVIDGDTELAVEQLQRSLEFAERNITSPIYNAIGVVAEGLLVAGNLPAARGHLLMQAGMVGDRDQRPMEQLVRLNMSSQVPLLLKDDRGYADGPPDVPWRGEFQAAMSAAASGSWLAACESLESLAQKVQDQSAILKNIAVLRGWLGQTELAVAAWRSYSQSPDLDLEDAVDAEALAQLIDSPAPSDEYDQVTANYPVRDAEALMETLLSDKRTVALPVGPHERNSEEEPPPKGVFWLLDRPAAEGASIEREDIPLVVGELQLHGKQTQRDARLELTAVKDESFPATKAILAGILGEQSSPPSGEKKLGTVSAITELFSWKWHLPKDITPERRRQLIAEQQEEAVTKLWPNLKLAILDRKRPVDVAGDEQYRVKLLAAILLLEIATRSSETPFDFNLLRDQLGLPRRQPVAVRGNEIMDIPLSRLEMLELEGLPDADLVVAFQRSVFTGHTAATKLFGDAILERNLPASVIERSNVYEGLIRCCQISRDTDHALEYCLRAQQEADAAGDSPAQWLLSELSLRLVRAEGPECQRIVRTLELKHLQEPGVADELYRLLVSFGLITPDGQPAQMRAEPSEAAPPAEPAGIWTPGSDAATQAPEGKSKLWVPGMD